MKRTWIRTATFLLGLGCLLPAWAQAQEPVQTPEKEPLFTFSATDVLVSKYIARGWRLTDGLSMQPSGVLSFKGFAVTVWGNLDLSAVNEGDGAGLKLPENPFVPPGSNHLNGMQGHFSEVDYFFTYSRSVRKVGITGGVVSYVYPDRSTIPASTEVYAGATFESLPLSPTATFYVDVDETRRLGKTGYYLTLAGKHSVALPHKRFSSLDFSGTLSFANTGFSKYYYGTTRLEDGRELHGPHDFNLTATLPCKLNDSITLSLFGAYSSLLGAIREVQYPNPRDVYLNRADSPTSRAGTWWGGISLSVSF